MKLLFDTNGKIIIPAAKQCLSRQGHYLYDAETKTYYYFNGKYYRPINRIVFEKKIVDLFGDHIKEHERKAILDGFTTKIASVHPLTEKVNLNKINLMNGVLDLTDLNSPRLLPHNKDYMFFNVVSAFYNPSAVSPNFDNFLNAVTLGDETLKLLLQELAGYCLIPGNQLQVAFILMGEGNNGKSVFLDLLRFILGSESTSSLSLNELGEKFKRSQLRNKLANISDEAPSGKEISSDVFKNLVSGGMITAEEKNKPPFQFTNNAKIITAANKVPILKEHTIAMRRRLIVIPFDYEVRAQERDLYLARRLKNEAPGILNWAIEGLKRLRLNGAFTDSPAANRCKEKFIKDGDSVLLFVEECCDITVSEASTLCRDLYAAYRKFCTERGYFACAENEFGKRLKVAFRAIQRTRESTGHRQWTYNGIALNEDASIEYRGFIRSSV